MAAAWAWLVVALATAFNSYVANHAPRSVATTTSRDKEGSQHRQRSPTSRGLRSGGPHEKEALNRSTDPPGWIVSEISIVKRARPLLLLGVQHVFRASDNLKHPRLVSSGLGILRENGITWILLQRLANFLIFSSSAFPEEAHGLRHLPFPIISNRLPKTS